MARVPVRLLLACDSVARGAAKLCSAVAASSDVWRERATSFLDVSVVLARQLEALRFVEDQGLLDDHLDAMTSTAERALTLAMRVHNLLPLHHPGSAAAFDAASAVASFSAAIEQLATDRGGDRKAVAR